MRFLRVKPEVDSRLCCVVIGNAYRKSSVCDRGLKMLSNPVLSIRLGVTADLDPRSKSAGGYGPLFADLDPPTKLSF